MNHKINLTEIEYENLSWKDVLVELQYNYSYRKDPFNNLTYQYNIALVTYGNENKELFESQGFIYINLEEQKKNKSLITGWGDENDSGKN